MIGAIILTFVITSLGGLVLFLLREGRHKDADNRRMLAECGSLRKTIAEMEDLMHRRRESRAYDQGLYDGRGTDTLYRQCLRKYTNRDQAEIMMNGEGGKNG